MNYGQQGRMDVHPFDPIYREAILSILPKIESFCLANYSGKGWLNAEYALIFAL